LTDNVKQARLDVMSRPFAGEQKRLLGLPRRRGSGRLDVASHPQGLTPRIRQSLAHASKVVKRLPMVLVVSPGRVLRRCGPHIRSRICLTRSAGSSPFHLSTPLSPLVRVGRPFCSITNEAATLPHRTAACQRFFRTPAAESGDGGCDAPSCKSCPACRAAPRPPMKALPAPVGSTTLPSLPGTLLSQKAGTQRTSSGPGSATPSARDNERV